jgi:hypothetical protein
MGGEAFDERLDLRSCAVWGVRKLIHGYPGGSGRDARISREEMLMEVVSAEANHREVDALCSLGS